MRLAIILAVFAATLAVTAPAAAQSRAAVLPAAAVTPLPAALAPAPSRVVSSATIGAPRSTWHYPRMGLLAGVVVGAAVGTYVMATADEWLAPPAHLLTVPAGALLGLAGGGIANLLDPP